MLNSILRSFANFVSSSKGSKIILLVWLVVIAALSVIAPSSGDVEENADEGSAHETRPSTEAQEIMDEQFPSDEGLVALLVFHHEDGITDEQRDNLVEMSEWLDSDDKPENVASSLPFHKFPEDVQEQFFSDDHSTTHINIAMKENLESGELYDTLQEIRDHADAISEDGLEMNVTGPAGISADTVSLFKNADLVLMLATIGLILILLMVIYRSPLLTIIPLVVAGMVYAVVDRVIGLGGDNSWFVVESQATSIMMILLFAVLTDYSLFVLSLFRQELKQHESKNEAMAKAFEPVLKPILFSGMTLLIAMLVLFLTDFKPYNHFAPVFSIAIVFILLGGTTLIPAIFTLAGRKAFWPFVPKAEAQETSSTKKEGFWKKVGRNVTKRPGITAGIILVLMLAASANIGTMKFSFNQLESFPEDIDSRVGYERLADHFPEGELAETNIVLKSEDKIDVDEAFAENINALSAAIKEEGGIEEITPEIEKDMLNSEEDLPRDFLSDSEQAVKLSVTLEGNPYSQSSLDVIDNLRDKEDSLLEDNGLDANHVSMQIAGQTAEQLDVRDMNQRDILVAFSLITVLITIMLMFQSGSVIMGLVMMQLVIVYHSIPLCF